MRLKASAVLVFCLAVLLSALAPVTALADEQAGEVVRVGWYESPFNATDQFGRRSGYAYEYQQKIAAHTGWTYEYVEGSWSELLQMIEEGQIDLLSDVSYTDERAQNMLYSSLPMGTEEYYAFISIDNSDITPEDFSTFNGKKVGVSKDSIQEAYFVEWEDKYGVEAEIVELTSSETDSLQKLQNGEIDAFVTLDVFGGEDACVPVCKIGSSDFFFAVSKEQPDLLAELDSAMSRIQDENRYYSLQLLEKYVRETGASAFLSSNEKSWLDQHGAIRVGYRDDYLPFCSKDSTTGELTGALKDYLDLSSSCMKNAQLEFKPIAYPTTKAALDALNSGEVDCVFPVNLSAHDGEGLGVIVADPPMRTEMYAMVRSADSNSFSTQKAVTAAIVSSSPNYDTFLMDYFPNWKTLYCDSAEECFQAVADGKADCVLVSNYRIAETADLCKRYNSSALSTGKTMNMSFAMNKGEDCLYSIFNKTASVIPSSTINSALNSYSELGKKVTFSEFIKDNLAAVIAIVATTILVIAFLLFRSILNRKRADEGAQLISVAELDHITKLYDRNFFIEYANRIYRDHPERHMDAVAMDIEQFHSINTLNGREFGDDVLRMLGEEIRAFLEETEGIAGRIEADRFDVYCEHQDDYQALLNRFQNKLNELSSIVNIQLRMGVMPWQEGIEPLLLFDRAWTACSMVRGKFNTHLMVYDEDMREREIYNQILLNDLRRALDEHEFKVYYQPKYDIQSEPPKLASAEALVRWEHPDLGIIPPDDFIPLFERNGQISAIDNYVWTQVAKQIATWYDELGVTVPVSVNLSRVDVLDPALETTLDELVEENGLEHNSLKLEITESAYTENADLLIRVIEELRAKGYEIEMDDFGTGYSSLNTLSSMPIDVLKMDMAFVKNIAHDERDMRMVKLVLDIAKNLNVPVVAEGVETKEQLALLKNAGCPLVQGFYFSRPLPPDEFEKLIAKGS